ncbi:helix-turn-helix domain-containing protein [Methylobacterium iners]|uniref:Helix-turn-helix domain-containing protein n=1 Tax=Methylobacterium iners TaxID=418707 RepID=A0ABQ4S3F3_9HYPH|nr:helix-turn-helix domain-containing protein [Methylobacterium iners]GJD96973.1 hypothetical protein OCOJLMKI_4201 [Methylobacterium iners]
MYNNIADFRQTSKNPAHIIISGVFSLEQGCPDENRFPPIEVILAADEPASEPKVIGAASLGRREQRPSMDRAASKPRPPSDDTEPRRSARSIGREKWQWLDGVRADHRRVNPTTFLVAFVVSQHLNAATREAWPSQRRMAELAGVSETTLRACLKTLIQLGHLRQGKKGIRNQNKYALGTAQGGTDAA